MAKTAIDGSYNTEISFRQGYLSAIVAGAGKKTDDAEKDSAFTVVLK